MDFDSLDENNPSPQAASADDLAILQAFEAKQVWESGHTPVTESLAPEQENFDDDADEMLMLFVSEVDEDVGTMQHALNQLEQEDHIQPAHYLVLHRAAHKIRGTAGAMECDSMAAIAHSIELIVDQITRGVLFPVFGVRALALAVQALEDTLNAVITQGKEQDGPLRRFEEELAQLNIELIEPEEPALPSFASAEPPRTPVAEPAERVTTPIPFTSRLTQEPASPNQFVRVDAHRFEHLVHHTEQMAEMCTGLESAQTQVDTALQELHTAQTRLQQLESSFATLGASGPSQTRDEQAASSLTAPSLITRILHDATQRNDANHPRHMHKAKARPRLIKIAGALSWDELEIERYTERDTLLQILNEAVADVAMASSHVRMAFTHLNHTLQQYTTQAATVRNDMLRLRLAPLSRLLPRLQRAISMSTPAQRQEIDFEVTGETTEIDQDILEALALLLLQLLRACMGTTFSAQDTATAAGQRAGEALRIWLHARGIGNEITIELGFSIAVADGGLAAMQETLQQMNGTIMAQPNAAGGLSFFLRLPRSHGAVRCLLVRSSTQHMLVPFSQVLRIADVQKESFDALFTLYDLLGLPKSVNGTVPRIQPALVLPREVGQSSIAVVVDEVVNEVELIVRPLPAYLRRHGIADAAIDSNGQVLLMIDLPALIEHEHTQQHDTLKLTTHNETPRHPIQDAHPLTVLIADDSVFIRRTLTLTLSHAGYTVIEARDGMEAQEILMSQPPDVFLVDVEMPRLNGYDLLNIVRRTPSLAHIKTIMLTSRTSDKHRQRALELGAQAYLTKPCAPDTLLEAIKQQVAQDML